MSFRKEETPQLPDEEPQTGESGLSDRNGTRREETLSDLPPASELHYDNVEYDVEDEYYILDQSDMFYVDMEDVCRGGRRRREQMAEDNIEEAPPRKRERMEQEDDEYAVFELTDLERTSSPTSSLSPTLDFSPVVDVPSSREHFRGRRRRWEQMTNEEDSIEEAPPRRRQRMEEEDDEYEVFEPIILRLSVSFPSELFPVVDALFSSEHFGWMRRSEQTTDEDSDEEAFYIRSQDGEFEDDEYVDDEDDEFDVTNLELIPSWWSLPHPSEFFPTVDAPFSSEHFGWMRRSEQTTDEDSDEVDSDEEAFYIRSQDGEFEDDEYVDDEDDEFEVTNLELIPSWWSLPHPLEFFPTVDAPFSSEHFWWMRRRQHVDSDEETPLYETVSHQNGVAGVTYVLIVSLSFSVVSLDPDGTVSISILSIPIVFLVIIINY